MLLPPPPPHVPSLRCAWQQEQPVNGRSTGWTDLERHESYLKGYYIHQRAPAASRNSELIKSGPIMPMKGIYPDSLRWRITCASVAQRDLHIHVKIFSRYGPSTSNTSLACHRENVSCAAKVWQLRFCACRCLHRNYGGMSHAHWHYAAYTSDIAQVLERPCAVQVSHTNLYVPLRDRQSACVALSQGYESIS